VRQPPRHREAIARVLDGRGEIAPERQAAVVGMRPAPAVHRARHGDGRGQDALEGNLREPPRLKPGDVGARGGAARRVQEAHRAIAAR
jgi:hypothetical protein